jgi:hypothetical protein
VERRSGQRWNTSGLNVRGTALDRVRCELRASPYGPDERSESRVVPNAAEIRLLTDDSLESLTRGRDGDARNRLSEDESLLLSDGGGAC